MGLDVYLRRVDDYKKKQRLEKEYNDFTEKMWDDLGDWETLSETQRDEAQQKSEDFASSLGLDEYGGYPEERIELDSALHPEHMFKIGYFRSSYNSGGINHLLNQYLGSSIYDLMGAENGDDAQVDWQASKERILKAKQDLMDIMAKQGGKMYSANFERAAPYDITRGADSEEAAMKLFQEEAEKEHSFGSFSNAYGSYFMEEPLKVSAMIRSTATGIFGNGFWIISERGDIDWYLESLDIMAETCDYVLAQPDIDKYYMYFSG